MEVKGKQVICYTWMIWSFRHEEELRNETRIVKTISNNIKWSMN